MVKLPEDIEAWVKALRSGEYQQVQGTLKGYKEDGTLGFCCLGVYCDLHGRKLRAYKTYGANEPHEGGKSHYKWLKKRIKPVVCDAGIEMNDDGCSFESIADMIEKKYSSNF